MRNLIGLGIMMLGVVTGALFPNPVSFALMFLGVFMFVSIRDEDVFCDYVIAGSEEVLVRKRHYYLILLFQLAISMLTLGLVNVKTRVMWKEEYYKGTPEDFKIDFEKNKISKKEYKAILREQRRIYSNVIMSREFMEKSYSPEEIGYKRKKRVFIAVCVYAVLCLSGLTVPADIFIVLILEAILIAIMLLLYPSYKDAKILHKAYERALYADTQANNMNIK